MSRGVGYVAASYLAAFVAFGALAGFAWAIARGYGSPAAAVAAIVVVAVFAACREWWRPGGHAPPARRSRPFVGLALCVVVGLLAVASPAWAAEAGSIMDVLGGGVSAIAGAGLEVFAGALATPIAVAIVGLLIKNMQKLGISVEEAHRSRLEEMTANALRAAAAKLGVTLHSGLSPAQREAVVTEAGGYLGRYGKGTVKALGGNPKDRGAMSDIVRGRFDALVGPGRGAPA